MKEKRPSPVMRLLQWAGPERKWLILSVLCAFGRDVYKRQILDEATAFTDPENEDKIQRSLMALSQGKTLLVIAHRLSTIQNADQIVVLEKGRIVDKGTQPELLSRCPLYQKLWQAHVGAQNWAVGKEA